MRRLLIGDRKVRVRDEGEHPRRPPVLLVHGAGSSSVVWMNAVKRIAPRRRAVAPDLPGHGQSDPWHDVSIDLYRDAVGTIAANLGLQRVVLVGHSMGGAVALRVALAWPERVAALVLVCTAARLPAPVELLAALERDPLHMSEWMARLSFAPATPRELVERWQAVAWTAPPETLLADLRAAGGFNVSGDLSRLRMPALVVGGMDDLLTPPALSKDLADGLPNARLLLVPQAGHMAHLEQPDRFHAALDPFLAEVA
ncbi:MAG TPA: alpha/beta fold hydrolase [Polyangia bacterium]|nr:alpha/beta fold hydrolase [Polyangia bacterium]